LVAITCLKSPSQTSAVLGYLSTSKSFVVLGRDSTNEYYYIQNAAVKGGYCWVWRDYAMVDGISYTLPVVSDSTATPAATLTPAATAISATATK
jgi:hypothetical protein